MTEPRRGKISARATWLVRGVVGAFAAAWVVALVVFVVARPVLQTQLPVLAAHPQETHNLVAYEYGPQITASSGSWAVLHHPAYLVDGNNAPTSVEKWVSDTKDKAPWVQLAWDRPRTVSAVSLVHAGAYESAEYTMHNYVIRCLPEGQPELHVHDNRQSRVTHALACPSASAVRLEFSVIGSAGPDLVRLYEMGVQGQ